MGWRIEFDDKAKKELAALDKPVARSILRFLRERVGSLEDSRPLGGPLTGATLGTFWKYLIEDVQIVASTEDDVLRILVVRVGHRREVYR